ncbi:MAG TPA: tectonin domain-containing protein, partial [Chloroflexota bacterium]|nr:tectonin domain-containing protein [Chloroflexota bacterium]
MQALMTVSPLGQSERDTWLGGAIELLAGHGKPLESEDRRILEDGYHADLSQVGLHVGPAADRIARALDANAVTCGSDIFFRAGRYRPDSAEGRMLLAHEVAHVLQQRRGPVHGASRSGALIVGAPSDRWEAQARGAAALVTRGYRVTVYPASDERAIPHEGKPPRWLQCHSSFEHRVLGDLKTKDLVAIANNAANRAEILQRQIDLMWKWHQNPEKVQEGDVQGLCPWIQTLRLGPGNILVTYGELNALPDYLANPVALDTVDPKILLPILQVIRQESYNTLTQIKTDKNPGVTFQGAASGSWQWSLVNNFFDTLALDRLTDRLGANSSDHYTGLLARNACHFAPFSWYRWLASHLIARSLAQQAHATTDSGERARLTQQAWVYHGYADHFLQDSFAAGHLLNKTLVMQWFVEWAAKQPQLVSLADWDQIKGMTTALQPNLGGLPLYNTAFQGPSNDPQTTEEHATQIQRMLGSGVQPAGRPLPETYQNYLTFLSNSVTQLASGDIHDYFNQESLWVSSVAHPAPYEVWGDETLLTGKNGGDGIQSTSLAAQASQEALREILNTGATSRSVQGIRDQFPTKAGTSSTNLQDLETFNSTQLRQLCMTSSFPIFSQDLKARLATWSPRVSVVSRDQTLTNVWNARLDDAVYNPVSVLTFGGRVFAGANGYVYEFDPTTGDSLNALRLLEPGMILRTSWPTQLATDGATLFVGVKGCAFGVDLTDWSKYKWQVELPGDNGLTTISPVSVVVANGTLYAGANGYAYQINPAGGQIIHSLSLLPNVWRGKDGPNQLVIDGKTLYLGVFGFIAAVDLGNWSKASWPEPVSLTAIGSGPKSVRVLCQGGRLFAGCLGFVYEISPVTGQVIHSLQVTNQLGSDDTTRLTSDGQTLFAGVSGHVYGVPLGDWAPTKVWSVAVGGTTGPTGPVSVLLFGGSLFAGANGYVYQISPTSGRIIASVLLTWSVGAYDTSLASGGPDLYVGCHGYAYKVLVQPATAPTPWVWGVNTNQPWPQNNIYHGTPTWQSLPGFLTDVAVAADGTMWGINATQPLTQNNIYWWSGSAWVNILGHLTQIAVGSANQVWGVITGLPTKAPNVYRWNGAAWVSVPFYLTDITAAADGTVWGVNASQTSGNNVYRWKGGSWTSDSWEGVAGFLTQISAGSKDQIWGVDTTKPPSEDNVYYWNGSNWTGVSGRLTSIAAAADGSVWGVNASQAGGNNVYAWNDGSWVAIAGHHLTRIAVGSAAQVVGVDATQVPTSNNIYQRGPAWSSVPGYLTEVSVSDDGAVWGLSIPRHGSQNNIYYWNGNAGISVPGYLTQIAVGSATQVWGVNANVAPPWNNIFRWN